MPTNISSQAKTVYADVRVRARSIHQQSHFQEVGSIAAPHLPLKCDGDHYDLVINGVEVGGGSRRTPIAKCTEICARESGELRGRKEHCLSTQRETLFLAPKNSGRVA